MNPLGKVVRSIQEGSLYLLLVLLPFSKAAVEVLFGVLLLGWLIERARPETRRQTLWVRAEQRRLVWALGMFLAACALSVVVSGHRWLSLNGLINKWLEYLLFVVIVADVASRPGVVTRCLMALSASVLLVGVEGLTQEFSGRGLLRHFPARSVFGRMTGPYENPGDLATFLMVVIPLFMTVWMTVRGWKRFLVTVLLLTLMGCVVRTGTVGAWLGLGAGLVLVVTLNKRLRRFGVLTLAVLMLGAGIWSHRDGRLHNVRSPMQDIGVADRLYMWKAAMRMIQDRPLFGHGLNTFMSNYLSYWVGGERQPRYAHNCYLQMAAETGLVGLFFFVGLLVLLFVHLIRAARRLQGNRRLILLGFVGGLFAFALQAGVDTNFYSLRQAALFWTLAGLAVGLSARAVPETMTR